MGTIEALLDLAKQMRQRLILRSLIQNQEWTEVADTIERLARDLSSALGGWRSMDSAPRDGTSILMGNYGGSEAYEGRYLDGSENHWGEAGWYFIDDDPLTSHPSHPDCWRPLLTTPIKALS